MKIKVLNAGDKVMNVTTEFVAIERANGEVDVLPLRKKGKCYVVDPASVLTLGYEGNEVSTEVIDGVTVTHF